jgi:monovalent cation/hydrogen antiporter
LNTIQFDPNLILSVVLPPILYYGAYWIPYREFKHNVREIFSLAIGLVFVTTFFIGWLVKWLFPEIPWSLAFAFGAIISPPDAIAATTILKRFALNSRVLTVLEGESLVNDAFALVLYRIAVVALLSGTFSWGEGSFEFIKVVIGGILVGLVLGYLLQNFSSRYLFSVTGAMFSLAIPYITYIVADSLGVSGVLAVVVNGLMLARYIIKHHDSHRHLLAMTSWDVFIILLNCFVFILIGLELRVVTQNMPVHQIFLYIGYAFLITFIMILIRMIWIYTDYGITYIYASRNSKLSPQCPQIFREGAILGWSGMRGIVSLTAVLALPLTSGTTLFNGRDVIIFITFVVIFLSLVIPGFSLPILLNWLKIHHHPIDHTIQTDIK